MSRSRHPEKPSVELTEAEWAIMRPVILLPEALPPGLWSEGLRTILAHELAHIWFADDKVTVIHMTRSDFPTH